MASAFVHRLLVVVPVGKVATVRTWLVANVDPTADVNLGPGLNPTGLAADPVTHRWFCGSYVEADCKAILVKLCQLAGLPVPTAGQWDNATRGQKINWLRSVQAALLAGYGVYVTLSDNQGSWDVPQAVLTAMGLKTISP